MSPKSAPDPPPWSDPPKPGYRRLPIHAKDLQCTSSTVTHGRHYADSPDGVVMLSHTLLDLSSE